MSRKLLIVAHPDDEAIFFSSIFDQADLVIICFTDIPNDINISNSRVQALANSYSSKIVSLNIPQSSSNDFFLVPKLDESRLGNYCDLDLCDFQISDKYEKNKITLFGLFSDLIRENDIIYTHNPWGEYGHIEHIQVFSVIAKLASQLKFKIQVYVNGYFGHRSYWMMRRNSYCLSKLKIRLKSNLDIYEKAEKHYSLYKCWTWSKNYSIPTWEYFYQLMPERLSSNSRDYNISHYNSLPVLIRHLIETNHQKISCLRPLFDCIDTSVVNLAPLITPLFVLIIIFSRKFFITTLRIHRLLLATIKP